MSGRGVLDADMATLGRWLADGWRWWIDELAGLAPPRWRWSVGDGLPRLAFRDDALKGARRGAAVSVLVPATACLTRRIERPIMCERDLRRMLALEVDSLLPFPPGAVVVAGREVGPAAQPGRSIVEVAGLPVERAAAIAQAAAAAGVTAARVIIDAPEGEPAIDFAPAMRDAGMLPRQRSAAPFLWALVAFFALVNVATLIGRDVERTDRFERLVAEQRPAITVARTIARRDAQDRGLIARSGLLRDRHNALGDLARTSRALPSGAWVQRYVWDGATLRIAGYRLGATDVAGALRRSGGFADVRSASDEPQAETSAGAPFDLSARIRGR